MLSRVDKALRVLAFLSFCELTHQSENVSQVSASWDEVVNIVNTWTEFYRDNFEPHWFRIISISNVSTKCEQSLELYSRSFIEWKPWAVEMADSSSKPPPGILDGTTADFGSFDQCLRIRVPGHVFQGKFCMVSLHTPLLSPTASVPSQAGPSYIQKYGQPPDWIRTLIQVKAGFLHDTPPMFAVCLPSLCTDEDVFRLFSTVTKSMFFNVTVSDCQVDEPAAWPFYAKVSVYSLFCLILLSVIGTLIDMYKKSTPSVEGKHVRVLRAFSHRRNFQKLFHKSTSPNAIPSIEGIRCLSSLLIIATHMVIYPDKWRIAKYSNLVSYYLSSTRWHCAPFEAILMITNFMFMSGFLLTYLNWRKIVENGGRFDSARYFIHKYFRLIPPVLLAMAVTFITSFSYAGPIWKSSWELEVENCRRYWWQNLLFLNNWYSVEQQCLIHTWFVSCLMQLTIVGVGLLLSSYRYPKLTAVAVIFMIAGCNWRDYLVAKRSNYQLPAPTVIKNINTYKSFMNEIYTKPFNHFGSYIVGMVVGYLVQEYRHVKIGKVYQVLGWTLSTVIALVIHFGIYLPITDVTGVALYIVYYRLVYSFSMGWVVYACATGVGGWLNDALSAPVFTYCGNLSYLVYLLHPAFLLLRQVSVRERYHAGYLEHVYDFIAIVVLSTFVSYCGYVLVEEPFGAIEGIIMEKTSIPAVKKDENENHRHREAHGTSESQQANGEVLLKQTDKKML